MGFAGESGQNLGRESEQKPNYFIGKVFTLEEREELFKEPTLPLPTDLADVEFTPNALHVLELRYLKKEGGKIVETPQEMLWRVADNIARVEELYEDNEEKIRRLVEEKRAAFYEMMAQLDFLPNSPTLMNAGRKLQQLSACFVLPVEDSMIGIFDSLKNAALIHQSGGGTGFSYSRLRHKGDLVRSTSGESSGPISFMEIYDIATGKIIQGGTRRGANMAELDVNHPDILEFINIKKEPGRLENFNLSVGINEDFMDAVRKEEEYDLISPRTGEVVSRLDAKEVFNQIIESAWSCGEPGIIFLDRINKRNPTPHLGRIEGTNPCGEQPLLPFESCNLGSINLSKFIENGEVDWERLGETVHLAVNFLDNVIDANKYTIPQIEEMTMKTRKIGLGIMGLADMLVLLRLGYESDGGRAKAREVMRFIQDEGRQASMNLAEKRGVFPSFEGSIFESQDGITPIRNATITTIAPTGSISIIAGCSGSGIEPFFALAYESQRRLGKTDEDNILKQLNPYFMEAAEKEGIKQEVIEKIIEKGKLSEINDPKIPEWMRGVFITSSEISAWGHIKMQAAIQEYTDNAVSKTINFPHSATKEDIAEAYLLADELNCRGLTVYRDGSRQEQVLYIKDREGGGIIERPDFYEGRTWKVKTPVGTLFLGINRDSEGVIREVFVDVGKAGSDVRADAEAMGRLLSLIYRIRTNILPEAISMAVIDQLKGIAGSESIGFGPEKVLSLPDAIAKGLEKDEKKREKNSHGKEEGFVIVRSGEYCPECQRILVRGEGCLTCRHCGYSKCS